MAVDAADIEQEWQKSDFSARMPGGAKGSDKIYDPYDKVVAEKMGEDRQRTETQNNPGGQFKAAPRRGLLSIIAGKLGF